MARLRYNGIKTTLGANLTGTTITLPTGVALTHSNGTNVPTITGSDYLPLSILSPAGLLEEIVWLTAYTAGASTGTVLRAQEGTPSATRSAGDIVTSAATALDIVPPGVSFPFTRTYTANQGDGVFAWMGTFGGFRGFINPAAGTITDIPDILGAVGAVTASQSSNIDGTRTADKATDHMLSDSFFCAHTQDVASSWWKVDFRAGHTLTPTKVAVVGRTTGGQHLRNWKVQGSNNDSTWTDLLTVTGAGPADAGWYAATITGSAAYRYIRIFQTGLNSSSANYLTIGDIEFWGTVA